MRAPRVRRQKGCCPYIRVFEDSVFDPIGLKNGSAAASRVTAVTVRPEPIHLIYLFSAGTDGPPVIRFRG